jgi:hypothetical protein
LGWVRISRRGLVEIFERRHDGQSADEFRDQAIFQKVLRLDLTEDFASLAVLGARTLALKPIGADRRARR